jgi:hypothetical protein
MAYPIRHIKRGVEMKNKTKVIGISILLMIAFTGYVLADSVDVETEWIVPADTGISASFPAHAGQVEFNCGGQNFTDQGATGQASGTSALQITNNGNTAVQIEGRWTTDWPTGVEYVNMSIDDWSNSTSKSYSDADETTNQTWVASLGIGASEDFWFWSTGHEVAETSGVTRTLRVYSTNV